MRLNFHKASSRQRNGHENQLLYRLLDVLGQEREKEEASVYYQCSNLFDGAAFVTENESSDDKSKRDEVECG